MKIEDIEMSDYLTLAQVKTIPNIVNEEQNRLKRYSRGF